jgi:hypothetical protein
VYITAYCCFIELARLSQEKLVLIHVAASDVGKAVFCLAQHIGAEIFLAVGFKGPLFGGTTQHYRNPLFTNHDLTFARAFQRGHEGQ